MAAVNGMLQLVDTFVALSKSDVFQQAGSLNADGCLPNERVGGNGQITETGKLYNASCTCFA